jgi:hypothetical protein
MGGTTTSSGPASPTEPVTRSNSDSQLTVREPSDMASSLPWLTCSSRFTSL